MSNLSIEQLQQVAQTKQVWSGNLISKTETKQLVKEGLVKWSSTPLKGTSDEEAKRFGGYKLTWRGKVICYLAGF